MKDAETWYAGDSQNMYILEKLALHNDEMREGGGNPIISRRLNRKCAIH